MTAARDKRISFIEETHVYLIDGVHDTAYYSVTQFVHEFIEHFDAEKVIAKMMSRPSWPDSKYYGKAPQDIVAEWDLIKNTAADLGTRLHLAIETFYNNELAAEEEEKSEQDATTVATVEYGYFRNFFDRTRARLVPLRTEWRIFDEDYKLAGSIDMVFRDTSDPSGTSVVIYDWKRSKEIRTKNWFQRCLPPLSHLDDCNYNHYALQLNVYKFIIERNYGLKVTALAIVVFHPNNDDYIQYDLPDMAYEIDRMMDHRRRQLDLSV